MSVTNGDQKAGTRLDFRRGANGVRRMVSDAVTAVGTQPDGWAWVVLSVNRETGEIDEQTVSLREAMRLLESTVVRMGDEFRALEGNPVGQLNGRGIWEIAAYCEDGEPRLFTAKDFRPATRKALPPELRFSVLERDSFTCRYCGRSAPDVVLHVDHIKAVVRGGTDDPENLATACAECNQGKGAR